MTTGTHVPGLLRCVVGAWLALATAAAAQTEFHYQYGRLTNPFSGAKHYTSILTVQHAIGWQLGDSFFFVDILEDGGHDGFNDKNLYGEWYPTLSLSKLAGTEFGLGPIRGIALTPSTAAGISAKPILSCRSLPVPGPFLHYLSGI